MKHIRKINEEWKTKSYDQEKLDMDEIRDLLVSVEDVGAIRINVKRDTQLDDFYEISYLIPFNLNLSSLREMVDERIDSIDNNLIEFNKSVTETYDVVRRLRLMGYKIAYVTIGDSYSIVDGLRYADVDIKTSGLD